MRIIWFCNLIAFIPLSAHAIVNVEDMRQMPVNNGFGGRLDLSISGNAGNTEKSSASIGAGMQWKKDRITNLFIINYAYGESDNVTDTNKGFGHFRHIVHMDDKRAYESFAQIQTDEFARLSFRGLLGGGIRYKTYEHEHNRTFLGAGAFYEWETLDKKPGITDDGTDSLWRANLYLVLNYQLNEHVSAVSTTYYQPAVEDLKDSRTLEDAGLRVKLTDDFDLKISINIAYDTRPPETVKDTDIAYSTALEFRF